MARTLSFLAALIAVIAGLGSALARVMEEGSWEAGVYIGLALYIAAGFAMLLSDRFTAAHCAVYAVGGLGGFLSAVLLGEHEVVVAYIYVALGAIPVFWVAYQVDKAGRKECPDCCQAVNAKARICHYCLYEFRQAEPD